MFLSPSYCYFVTTLRKRKTIAIVFIAFVALPIFFSGTLQLFQLYLKQSVEQRLKSGNLTDLKIPLGNVEWVEEGREIMFDDKMYDIETYREENGFLIAKAVFDGQETAVMDFIMNFQDQEQSNFIINLLVLVQALAFSLHFLFASLLPFAQREYFSILRNICPDPFTVSVYQPPRQLPVIRR
jgi:hypothetical protein